MAHSRCVRLRAFMEQSSNSLLGKVVRSRRALHVVGNALLQDGKQTNQPMHDEAIDLRPKPKAYVEPQQAPVQQPRRKAMREATDDAWVPLIDPHKLFSAIASAKRLILATSLIGLLAGALYAMSIPKYYYSTAEILIDPRDLQISDRELLPTGLPYDASLALVENQTRILTSRRVILGTVEKLSLDRDAEYTVRALAPPIL